MTTMTLAFHTECNDKAIDGVLLIKCPVCGHTHEMVYQDGGHLPMCTACDANTEWVYSLAAIDYLNEHYPIVRLVK